MSNKLFRRFTFHREDMHHSMRLEGAEKMVKSLLKSLEAYTASRTPERLAEIGSRVSGVWHSVFDTEKATAPQKKYDLAEEMLLRPDVMKLLLMAFRLVQIDVKRKIRDLFRFVIEWCSNDSADSCVQRSRAKTKFSPKVRDQLYYCRAEVVDIVAEGYDEPSSVVFYNDIIREYVKDDVCLATLLDDDGRDAVGFAARPHGCIWAIFERLTLIDRKTHIDPFDVTVATFDTLQIILGSPHEAVHLFLEHHLLKFSQCVQKLIASANFYVQARALRLLHELFSTQRHSQIRSRWLGEPSLIRLIVLALQSNKKVVRTEAVALLEMIIENPDNTRAVHDFITRNRNALIIYCFESAPRHMYKGNKCEFDDARFAKIAYKLLNWGRVRPFSEKEQAEFEEAERLQHKMREEQTVPTSFQDFIEGLPTVRHEFSTHVLSAMPLLREPMQFGAPPK